MNGVFPVDETEQGYQPQASSRRKHIKTFKPIISIKTVTAGFIALGLGMLTVGMIVYSFSIEIIELVERYDDQGGCQLTDWESPTTCTVSFTVPEDVHSTVFCYYELHGFYQNNRRYSMSKSDEQLAGNSLTKSELTDCDPVVGYEDLGRTEVATVQRTGPANPCGLIAKTVFNDTFVLRDGSENLVHIEETGIAWESDIEEKFARNAEEYQWTDVEDEHFIVWMRTSGLPNFRKLWGKIEHGLDQGEYTLTVNSFYDVSDFDGKKYFVLSNVNGLGGKNSFIIVAYLAMGALSLALGTALACKSFFCKFPKNR